MPISQETKDAIAALISATESIGDFNLRQIMRDQGLSYAFIHSDSGDHAAFRGVNWNDEQSIARLIPIVEEAYQRRQRLPKLLKFKHEMRLKSALSKDRLRIRMAN